MNRISAALMLAWVPLLPGCMMGGLGHATGMGGVAHATHTVAAPLPGPIQRAEASNGALTIGLSFPTPSGDAVVAIDAWLLAADATSELTDGQIVLRIQTPSGNVGQLRMQRVTDPAVFRAQYSFPGPGRYIITAEGRSGTGTGVRTVSVTTRTEVGGETHDSWLMPMAIVGGLGMFAAMPLTMGGYAF